MRDSVKSEGIDWRHGFLVSLTLIPVCALFLLVDPIIQPQEYHDFADSRALSGIPNIFDVSSNLAFLFTGLAGVYYCLAGNVGPARQSWLVMFTGIALVSLGSAYYHYAPGDQTLVWDRAAMTVGFMGLFTALLVEYISVRLAALLAPLVILGISSVFYGYYFDDLRFYVCVQFVPLLMIPIVIALFESGHSHQRLLLIGLLWYLVAKISEHFDVVIFQMTGELISGHTSKHLLAALGCYCVLIMLKVRVPKPLLAEAQ